MSELHLSPNLKRILLEAIILCALALTIGLSLNFRMVMNAFTGKSVVENVPKQQSAGSVATPSAAVYPDPVELDEIDELLAEGALLVDARHSDDYRAGHLQGAVSLPLGEVESKLGEFAVQVPKQRVLILYCNGFGCPDSFDLGMRLISAGYRQVRVYEGGYPQWRDEGRVVEVGE